MNNLNNFPQINNNAINAQGTFNKLPSAISNAISAPCALINENDNFLQGNNNNTSIESIYKSEYKEYCAGILPYHVKGNMIYFLLGRDSDGRWSDFGGHSEPTDSSIEFTACREFYEETIGSVLDIYPLIDKITNKKYYVTDITPNGYTYYMYLLRVPYTNYRDYFKSTYYFIKYMNKTNKNIDFKFLEKTDIQWISLDTLQKAIHTDNSEYTLRYIFKKNLQNSIDEIVDYCNKNIDNVF